MCDVAPITHVLCSDAEGRLAKYRAGPSLVGFFSVNDNWFDQPNVVLHGVFWVEPPVDRARVLCEEVVATIMDR